MGFYLMKLFKCQNGNYLYDALTNRLLKIPEEYMYLCDYFTSIGNIPHESYFEFLQRFNFRDFTKKVKFDISFHLSKKELEYCHKNYNSSFMLSLTEHCNFRCEYCSYMDERYLDNEFIYNDMSKEIAFKAIDLLIETSGEDPDTSLGFYGGEPLLKFDLIKSCVEYCKKNYPYKIPHFFMITNGFLLNDEICDFLIENNISINVSFDGPQKLHDRYRLHKNKLPTHARILNNLKTIYEKSPTYYINNINFNVVLTPSPDTKQVYDYIHLFPITHPFFIDVKIGKHFREVLDQNKIKKFSDDHNNIKIEDYQFLYSDMIAKYKRYNKILSNNYSTNLQMFPGAFCVPGLRKNYITANGKILVCERVDDRNPIFEIGDVWSGIDGNKVEKLISETKEICRKKCEYCWAARFCDICFSRMFDYDENVCQRVRKKIYSDIIYYLDNIVTNSEILDEIENTNAV